MGSTHAKRRVLGFFSLGKSPKGETTNNYHILFFFFGLSAFFLISQTPSVFAAVEPWTVDVHAKDAHDFPYFVDVFITFCFQLTLQRAG